jgi:hypothetical protein
LSPNPNEPETTLWSPYQEVTDLYEVLLSTNPEPKTY